MKPLEQTLIPLPAPSASASPTRLSQTKQALRSKPYSYTRLSPLPPCPGGWGEGHGGWGLALEAQLLVLGCDVLPEQFQGLVHGCLGVGTKLCRMPAVQNMDDGVRDELQGQGQRGTGHGQDKPGARWESARTHLLFIPGLLFIEHLLYIRHAAEQPPWINSFNPYNPVRQVQMGKRRPILVQLSCAQLEDPTSERKGNAPIPWFYPGFGTQKI